MLHSQDYAIKITNPNSDKEILLKPTDRIRLKTIANKKVSGRFQISKEGVITIRNRKILLKDVIKIKRNPMALAILTSSCTIYSGSVLAAAFVLIGALNSQNSLLWLAIPTFGAAIYTGIKSPNLLKGYKKDKGWEYEIVPFSE